ncbi:unnamed protein product, partial [Musa hybrid cultivar]
LLTSRPLLLSPRRTARYTLLPSPHLWPSDRPSEPDHYDRSLPRPGPDRRGLRFPPSRAAHGRHFDEDERKPFDASCSPRHPDNTLRQF